MILNRLDDLIAEFDRASILLTPHLLDAEENEAAVYDNELHVLKYGVYNLGFLGVKSSPEGRRFASWWSARLGALVV